MLDDRERRLRLQFRDEYEVYARACLKIRPKKGLLVPFRLNRAQLHVHTALEEQRRRTGRVRALVVKARQQGCSTYIGGRFYHRVTHTRGLRAYILTHEQQATNNLFDMVDRFQRNTPELVRPHVGKSNAKELEFDILDSGYSVGTAGTKGVGRSATLQLFHGSEVAFWPNADTHLDGILQAVPDLAGTEVILESTGNGKAGLFYLMVQAAIRGESEFIVIFTPWWWSPEYSAEAVLGEDGEQDEEAAKVAGLAARVLADPDSYLSPPWREYQRMHGVTASQIAWAFAKNATIASALGIAPAEGPCWKFRQEYPATLEEAFQVGSDKTFIPGEHVVRARKTLVEPSGPLIVGVDPAREGSDSTGVIDRRGRRAGNVIFERWKIPSVTDVASRLAELIRKHQVDIMPIDVTGLGAGVFDTLVSFGFASIVHAIKFGGAAQDPTRYRNRRAEIWDRAREWFAQQDTLAVCIPDDDALESDLTAPAWLSPTVPNGCRFVGDGLLQLEAKENIRKRLGISPDLGDAFALTFAVPSSHVLPPDQQAGRGVRVLNDFDPLS